MKLEMITKNRQDIEKALDKLEYSLTGKEMYEDLDNDYKHYDKVQQLAKKYPKQIKDRNMVIKKTKNGLMCQSKVANDDGTFKGMPTVKFKLIK